LNSGCRVRTRRGSRRRRFRCGRRGCLLRGRGHALLCTRRGGRIIVTGMFLDPVGLDLTAVNLNELELVGSVVYDHQDFREAVEWIQAGRFEFRKLVTHILPLDMAQDALTLLTDRAEDAVKVLLEIPR